MDPEQTRLELERVSGITSAVRVAGLPSEFASKLVTEGVTLNDSRAQVVAELERIHREPAIDGRPHVTAVEGGDARDKFQRGALAWLLTRSGDHARQAKERGVPGFANLDLDGGEFRGMSLMDIARTSLDLAGVRTKGMTQLQVATQVLEVPRHRASTTDFGTLFESALYKSMRAAYALTADVWSKVCGTDTVSDFRPANRYMTGALQGLPVVAEGAEFRNLAIPDGTKVSISTETRGGIIHMTRQSLINDDMGALSDLAVALGRSCKRSIETEFFNTLAMNSGLGPTMSDTNPFFYSGRGNVSAGAALSVAAIDADRVKMAQQRDSEDLEYLELVPKVLLVPSALGAAARVLNSSTYDHDSTQLNKPNAVHGLFDAVVDTPRISGVRRYLFTSPASGCTAFKVVFLEGSGEGPTIERQEGWRIDGSEWKARIDFKVNAFDPKCALTNAGV